MDKEMNCNIKYTNSLYISVTLPVWTVLNYLEQTNQLLTNISY